MPELPEVESARTLRETHCAAGATVTAVAFLEDGTFDEKIFAGTTAKAFRSALLGEPWRRRSAWENTCGGRWQAEAAPRPPPIPRSSTSA